MQERGRTARLPGDAASAQQSDPHPTHQRHPSCRQRILRMGTTHLKPGAFTRTPLSNLILKQGRDRPQRGRLPWPRGQREAG